MSQKENSPTGRELQIINERKKKIKELKDNKINPYKHKFDKKNSISDCLNSKLNTKVQTAGRIITKRDLGKISFYKLQDQVGEIQLVLQKDKTSEEIMKFAKRYADSGDFIGVSGNIFKTKTGEKSILVDKIEILTKAVLPLPEKYHGLQDEEERLRKRYLDMLINPQVRETFEIRSKLMKSMREFMEKNNFIEIETPLLQGVYGGAAAEPFKTYCNAFNSELYLSIAPELYLKKALVGGFDRVYEVTKKFRNEGVDRQHNPEHMTIEWYQGYADYKDGMNLVKDFICYISKQVFGKTIIEYQGNKIDLSKWQTLSLEDAIKKYLNEDISKIKTNKEAREIAKKHNIDEKGITKTNIADELMKLFREKLIQPTFLIDYPIGLAPLAKAKPEDQTKAEIFQPFIGGMELARAYSELSDPQIQEEHFKEQEKEREEGNKEAMPTDSDFVTALEHGLPPACGVGFGIERLIMLFTNKTSIREAISFPFVKPETQEENKKDKNKINKK
ncbi:MAG: lysine--tRNA ligase [Nanoarchaeota archaeon]